MEQTVLSDGAHLHEFLSRKIVGVAVLGHPVAESLFDGDGAHRIDRQNLDVTVYIICHEGHGRSRRCSEGLVEIVLPGVGLSRETPGGGIGVWMPVDHSD